MHEGALSDPWCSLDWSPEFVATRPSLISHVVSVARSLERRLERLIEGVAGRVFSKHVHGTPVFAGPRCADPAPGPMEAAIEGDTVWEAMRTQPLRIAFSPWPLRAFAYLASGAVVGAFTLVWLPLALLAGVGVLTPLAMQPLVALERRRIMLLGGPALSDPHRPPDRPGLVAWLRLRHSEAATWRELAYSVLHGTVLLAFDLVATLLALSPGLVLILVLKPDDPPPPPPGDGEAPAGLSDVVAPVLLLAFGMIVAVFAICYAVVLAATAHAALAHGAGPFCTRYPRDKAPAERLSHLF